MSYRGLLNDVAVLERSTVVTRPSGEQLREWAVVARGVPCSIQGAGSPAYQTDAGRAKGGGRSGWVLPTLDVRIGDRLTIPKGTFDVLSVDVTRSRITPKAVCQLSVRERVVDGAM
jgi:head-tail adaptor